MAEVTKLYKNSIRLDNSRAVQRLIARTINLLNSEMISENKARCIGYLCNILLDSFETVDFEQRISTLEERLSNRREGYEYKNKVK